MKQKADTVDDIIQTSKNVLVGNPQHPPAARSKISVATGIMRALGGHAVGLAIDLNDEMGAGASKVGNVGTYRMLATETAGFQRTRAQTRP